VRITLINLLNVVPLGVTASAHEFWKSASQPQYVPPHGERCRERWLDEKDLVRLRRSSCEVRESLKTREPNEKCAKVRVVTLTTEVKVN
jgi:hypothetical protein